VSVAPVVAEARKLPAFLRRDALVMLSYRGAFVGDLVFIGVQALVFSFLAQIVDTEQMPTYGGTAATYMEFVMIGVVISTVSMLLLQRVASAMRSEQMMGTLEALLTSPTSPATIQAGSIAFDLMLIPARMAALLVLVAVLFDLDFQLGGIVPAMAVFAAFLPFVWGLGLVAAASVLTFRRGGGLAAAAMSGLALVSGAFFPLALLPGWIQTLAAVNPVAIALDAIREALIGGAGWSEIAPQIRVILPLSALAALCGAAAFRAALAREHRHGTLGLY
jgi:ABC-2 type transport system permease protein